MVATHHDTAGPAAAGASLAAADPVKSVRATARGLGRLHANRAAAGRRGLTPTSASSRGDGATRQRFGGSARPAGRRRCLRSLIPVVVRCPAGPVCVQSAVRTGLLVSRRRATPRCGLPRRADRRDAVQLHADRLPVGREGEHDRSFPRNPRRTAPRLGSAATPRRGRHAALPSACVVSRSRFPQGQVQTGTVGEERRSRRYLAGPTIQEVPGSRWARQAARTSPQR